MRMSLLALIAAGWGAWAAWTPSPALACTGDGDAVVRNAEMVIAGPVIARTPAHDYDPVTRSVTYTVQVERYLKGSGAPVVDFRGYVLNTCAMRGNGDRTYFVGALSRDEHGVLVAHSLGLGIAGEGRSDPDVVAALTLLEQILRPAAPVTGNAGLVDAEREQPAAAYLTGLTVLALLVITARVALTRPR